MKRSTCARAWLTGFALAMAACANATSAEPAASGSGSGSGAGSGAGSAATAKPATAELLGAMAMLVGRAADPAHVAEWAKKIDGGQAPIGSYIDEILETERFAGEVIPALVFGSFVNVRNYYALPSAFVLKRSSADAPVYLRAPCTAAEAITVQPWWDLRSEIQVCPDAYRPDKWTMTASEHSYRTSTVLTCDSQVGSPELETSSLCGCGPNLIRCLRDEDQYNQFNRSFMDEVKRTTAYIVEHDLPMATLFTGNSTFRDRNVELYYRRQKIGALELRRVKRELTELGSWPAPPAVFAEPEPADLGTWPQGGKWAPREELRPGQHAGVLTAPQILHWFPDQRQRQRAYYEMMWCNLRNSFGATTHKVLELNASGNNFFSHDSWQRLAHTELCTNCHARLDYGAQFFRGYPDSRASTHYNPALQSSAKGPLYGQDIRDPRGEAPLTPVGFAKLATTQPDFKSCMTNHFVSYVLGDRATAEDVRAIDTAVEKTRTFKAAMKVALERYVAHWRATPVSTPPAAAAVADTRPGPTGGVMVSAALRSKLEQRCVECHDKAPYTDAADSDDLPFDFTGSELPRSLVVSMAEQVAFGMMPKDQLLDPQARDELVSLLIDALWMDPAARTEARRYYLGRARGLPAHQIDNALFSIDHLAHAASGIGWGALERGIWSDQSTITPGFLAITGLEAIRACARANARNVSLEDCVLQATSVNGLSRWPLPSRAP